MCVTKMSQPAIVWDACSGSSSADAVSSTLPRTAMHLAHPSKKVKISASGKILPQGLSKPDVLKVMQLSKRLHAN